MPFTWCSARQVAKTRASQRKQSWTMIRKLAGTERQVYMKITQARKSRRHCVINLGRHLIQSWEGNGKRDQKPKLESEAQRVYTHRVKKPGENLGSISLRSRQQIEVILTRPQKQNWSMIMSQEFPGEFPGGPLSNTQHSQCRGPRFNPWLGN